MVAFASLLAAVLCPVISHDIFLLNLGFSSLFLTIYLMHCFAFLSVHNNAFSAICSLNFSWQSSWMQPSEVVKDPVSRPATRCIFPFVIVGMLNSKEG